MIPIFMRLQMPCAISPKRGYNLELLTYLYPSKVCKGVGVYALTTIPKDTCIFKSIGAEKVNWSNINQDLIPKIQSLTNWDDRGFWINSDLSRLSAEYYVNHSYEPNVMYDHNTYSLYAIRDIKKDEELLQYYLPTERDWQHT
jgi:SET domain-containing protein